MAADTGEIAHLLELLETLAPLSARRMFGGWGVYAGGVMVALVADGELLLKTDAQSRPQFEQAGSRPFVFRARGRELAMSYWSVPEDALDSSHAMRPWARLALDAALRASAAKPPRRKRVGTVQRRPQGGV